MIKCIAFLSTFFVSLSAASASTFSRAPYVQLATEDSIHVVWRCDKDTKPKVRYGTHPAVLDKIVDGKSILVRRTKNFDKSGQPLWNGPDFKMAKKETIQYEAKLSGLKPNTTYYYAVYDGEQRLTPSNKSYRFSTHPKKGSKQAMRFWVVGDSGTGGKMQQAVHQGMLEYIKKSKKLDFYMHVGDMAYGSGRDKEFSKNFFSMYEPTLRNTVCWASMGNHEGYTANGKKAIGPYYDAYILPTKAEAGGVPSGTEAYYSYDYGNAHFICLNSHDLDRKSTGAMAKWLKADLDKTKAEWLIAFWHHPPYTKGSHDSDKEKQLIEMREHIMPILEAGGIDAVFTGHSHIYERSMLIDGAYQTPSTNEGVVLDDGDGNPKSDGAYKKSAGLAPHNGAVQVVTGHGGTGLRRGGIHPLMSKIIMRHGSMIIDIKDNKLTGQMIDFNGETLDTFSIEKKGKVAAKPVLNPKSPQLIKGKSFISQHEKMPKKHQAIIAPNANWNYLAGKNLHAVDGWTKQDFDLSHWKVGKAGFGYGDKDDRTELDMKNKFTVVYIRKEFEITKDTDLDNLGLAITFDDAFIAYINGQEVARTGVDFGRGAKASGFHTNEARSRDFYPLKKFKKFLKPGKNVLAIEGHNCDISSSDFTLDPFLTIKK